jgi:hypothetical protein
MKAIGFRLHPTKHRPECRSTSNPARPRDRRAQTDHVAHRGLEIGKSVDRDDAMGGERGGSLAQPAWAGDGDVRVAAVERSWAGAVVLEQVEGLVRGGPFTAVGDPSEGA